MCSAWARLLNVFDAILECDRCTLATSFVKLPLLKLKSPLAPRRHTSSLLRSRCERELQRGSFHRRPTCLCRVCLSARPRPHLGSDLWKFKTLVIAHDCAPSGDVVLLGFFGCSLPLIPVLSVLNPGRRVRVHSLVKMAEYNGREGVVRSVLEVAWGRGMKEGWEGERKEGRKEKREARKVTSVRIMNTLFFGNETACSSQGGRMCVLLDPGKEAAPSPSKELSLKPTNLTVLGTPTPAVTDSKRSKATGGGAQPLADIAIKPKEDDEQGPAYSPHRYTPTPPRILGDPGHISLAAGAAPRC
jgi:hypothetical protein